MFDWSGVNIKYETDVNCNNYSLVTSRVIVLQGWDFRQYFKALETLKGQVS